MSTATVTAETTVTHTASETVAKAAADVFKSTETLAKRTEKLGRSLASMHAEYVTNGRDLTDYVSDARDLLKVSGDWETVNADVRKAVAVIAGTTGRLSSVMVAEALGLSQSTASRVIRAAKKAEIDEAVKAAKANGEDVETAKYAATNRANAVITAAGHTVDVSNNGKGSKSDDKVKSARVLASVTASVNKGYLTKADRAAILDLLK